MGQITKQDVYLAFTQNVKGRNLLLYHYYREQYFTGNLPNKLIALKISEDLNYTITINMVRLIIKRIVKKQNLTLPYGTSVEGPLHLVSQEDNSGGHHNSTRPDISPSHHIPVNQRKHKTPYVSPYQPKNADDLPKEDQFGGRMDHI